MSYLEQTTLKVMCNKIPGMSKVKSSDFVTIVYDLYHYLMTYPQRCTEFTTNLVYISLLVIAVNYVFVISYCTHTF
jgi:predicted neutral ceramidase superfamily lipid hydrolase